MENDNAEPTRHEAERLRKVLQSYRRDLEERVVAMSRTFEAANRALAGVEVFLDEISPELEQGHPFANHNAAFDRAKEHVKQILASKRDSDLRVRVLAVAATYSWRFLSEVLPDLIVDTIVPTTVDEDEQQDQRGEAGAGGAPFSLCSAELLLVEPAHLRTAKAGRNGKGEEWWKISRDRQKHLKQLIQRTWTPELMERYSLSISYYKNIPHWHGVLVSDDWLLLGRTSWVVNNSGHSLRVGENQYRLFTDKTEQGRARIKLFASWFSYYKHNGRPS